MWHRRDHVRCPAILAHEEAPHGSNNSEVPTDEGQSEASQSPLGVLVSPSTE